uniref:outer membrane beta-barrel protein n=1 Tax=Thaumasiovibrio occultus TaxID=1891184 RepID=UPI000B362AF5|nr:outer membrane beta-barrel protein [Thaumasiovibrio occultus]
MDKQQTLLGSVALILASGCASNTQVDNKLFLEGEILASDNINFNRDEQSDVVESLSVGLEHERTTRHGFSEINYRATAYHYHESDNRDDFSQHLDLSAEQGLGSKQWYVMGDAAIRNVSSDVAVDAIGDVVSGDTVEEQALTVGFGYRSQSRFIDANALIYGDLKRYDDGDGDYEGYGAQLNTQAGDALNRYITDLSVRAYSRDSDTTDTQTITGITSLGYLVTQYWAPVIAITYQDYDSSLDINDRDFFAVGIGARYQFDRFNYFQLTYNRDDDDENFVGTELAFYPHQRLRAFFRYGQRVYGNAYDFSLTYLSRRWMNEISYTEEINSFDRDFAGVADDSVTVERVMDWVSTLRLRRAEIEFLLGYEEKEELNNFMNEEIANLRLGARYQHELSPRTTASIGALYREYQFDDGRDQNDDYLTLDMELRHYLSRTLSFNSELRYKTRDSNQDNRDADEFRVTLSLRKDL